VVAVRYCHAGQIQYTNPAWRHCLGYLASESISQPLEAFIYSEDVAKYQDFFRCLHTSENEHCELRLLNAHGKSIWFDLSFCNINIPAYNVGMTALLYNIDQRKNLEIKLQESQCALEKRVKERTAELSRINLELSIQKEKAEVANIAKTTFLQNMSHELRTPLNAVIGYTELLIEEAEDSNLSHIVADAKKVAAAGNHLLQLVTDILDITCIESNTLPLNIQPVLLSEVMPDALLMAKTISLAKNIPIIMASDMHPSQRIDADPVRLKQVLLNLLTNACKYNKPGGRVLVSVEHAGDIAYIKVEDTGWGLSNDNIDMIFKPFNRQCKDPSIEGTGVGLALTKVLVESMKGEIGVHSKVGEGSIFWVAFRASCPQHGQYAI
jgi:PAS domain S-box-containing protein